jgi:hypothetical protein
VDRPPLPEPTEFGTIVRDNDGTGELFVRVADGDTMEWPWRGRSSMRSYYWKEIERPVLVRAGVIW